MNPHCLIVLTLEISDQKPYNKITYVSGLIIPISFQRYPVKWLS